MTPHWSSHIRQGWFLALLLTLSAAQIPLLTLGYGADADAWRVANTADILWRTGVYEPSRLPGYPLHEFLIAPLTGLGGALLSNLSTLIASILLVVVWSSIAAREGRHQRLLIITLACTPLLWINYSVTLDYVWSLLFLLLSFSAVLRGKTIPAGLLLGVATGFRPTNLIVGAGFILLIMFRDQSLRRVGYFIAATLCATMIALLPLLIKYGPVGWISETLVQTQDVHLPMELRVLLFIYRGVYSPGPVAIILALWILYRSRKDYVHRLVARDGFVIACLVVLAAVLGIFFLFPLERTYLLPAFPFLYLLIDRFATKRMMAVFTAGIISFGIINPDIVRHKIPIGEPGANVHWGMVVEDWQRRAEFMRERSRIAGMTLPDSSMLITGMGPVLFALNEGLEPDTSDAWRSLSHPVYKQRAANGALLVEFLGVEEFHLVRARGFRLYCLANARPSVEHTAGLRLADEGIDTIP